MFVLRGIFSGLKYPLSRCEAKPRRTWRSNASSLPTTHGAVIFVLPTPILAPSWRPVAYSIGWQKFICHWTIQVLNSLYTQHSATAWHELFEELKRQKTSFFETAAQLRFFVSIHLLSYLLTYLLTVADILIKLLLMPLAVKENVISYQDENTLVYPAHPEM